MPGNINYVVDPFLTGIALHTGIANLAEILRLTPRWSQIACHLRICRLSLAKSLHEAQSKSTFSLLHDECSTVEGVYEFSSKKGGDI